MKHLHMMPNFCVSRSLNVVSSNLEKRISVDEAAFCRNAHLTTSQQGNKPVEGNYEFHGFRKGLSEALRDVAREGVRGADPEIIECREEVIAVGSQRWKLEE